LSFVYKVVEDLVDDVLDRMKEGLDDYAETAKREIELFADKLVRRAVKGMAVGLFGAVMVSAGLIFSLLGLVTYLSQMMNPAFAWGLVGFVMVGIGGVLLFTLLRRSQGGTKLASRHNGGN
jgi:hypothetical protein